MYVYTHVIGDTIYVLYVCIYVYKYTIVCAYHIYSYMYKLEGLLQFFTVYMIEHLPMKFKCSVFTEINYI